MDIKKAQINLFNKKPHPKVPRPHTALNDPLYKHSFKLQKKIKDKPSEIQILSRDGVRRLRCKSAFPQVSTARLTLTQLNEIKKAATVVPVPDKIELLESQKKVVEEQANQQEKRKEEFHQKELEYRQSKHSSRPSSASSGVSEDILRKQYIDNLEEAKELRRIVLGVKCHAIREAQMKEKEAVRIQELREQEKFSQMMKDNLRRALEKEKEKDKIRQQETVNAAQRLSTQIADQRGSREKEAKLKKLEEERFVEETKKQMEEERLQEIADINNRKQKMREEAEALLKETQERKRNEITKDKYESIVVLREKIKRDEEMDKEKKRREELRKSKISTNEALILQKEKQLKEEAKRKELQHLREIEDHDRIWRTKILEAEKEKRDKIEKEKHERQKQFKLKQELKEAARLKEKEIEKSFQQHSIVKEGRHEEEYEKELKRKETTQKYLREQMEEHRKQKEERFAEEKKEHERIAERIRVEEQALNDLRKKTLDELQTIKLPDKLMDEFRRKILPPKKPTSQALTSKIHLS